jgi:peptidoglycan/LPS O-acetylase OafA/YrhL
LSRLDYRPDIDGLRAVAVLAVLLHHLAPTLLSGGFIGVDIFFVISGYLITSHIYKEASEGRFSLRQFYKRRINRIVPALMTVMAATMAAGIVILSPSDLVRLTKSAICAGFGLSNFYIWHAYGNYFRAVSSEAPLLHTWSLGVEEQFYAIWPLLILLLLKFNKRYWLGIFAVLTVGALAVSQAGTLTLASAAYYLLPSRFFELMIGGMLALIAAHRQPASRLFSELSSIAGFALIGISLVALNGNSTFPGIHALWPCLGAALLIWSGSKSWLTEKILAARPMVFLGMISYSIYLWHWPIISSLNYFSVPIGPAVGLAVAAASILLAWLSWKFVEGPMRRSGAAQSFSRVLLRRFAVPVGALVCLGAVLIASRGLPQRFDPRVARFDRMLEAAPDQMRRKCHLPSARYSTPPDAACRLGAQKDQPDGILIGDSFANHFTGMIDVMANSEGISIMDYTLDACPPIQGYNTGRGWAYERNCLQRNEMDYRLIASGRYRRVILAANWPRNPDAGTKLASSIDAILKSGATITLILNNEEIPGAASCPIRRLMYGFARSCDSVRAGPPSYLKTIEAKYPQVHIVDPNRVICDAQNLCHPVLDDKLLYKDDDHLNDIGSREIGEKMLSLGATL